MERLKYNEILEKLRSEDEFIATLIEDSVLTAELVFDRKLNEDEKMLVYSSFMTGRTTAILEQKMLNETYNVCLN